MKKKHRWLRAIVIIIAIPLVWIVGSFIVGFVDGFGSSVFPPKPVFFGLNVAGEYEHQSNITSASDSYYWLLDKYENYDRPYVFDKVYFGEHLEAKIHKISDFYGQDMAMLLVTRKTQKVAGVIVAAKCEKGERGQVADEIISTICRKHKNVLVSKVSPEIQLRLCSFIRRPALHCVASPRMVRQMVCKDENFEAYIVGVDMMQVEKPRVEVISEPEDEGIIAGNRFSVEQLLFYQRRKLPDYDASDSVRKASYEVRVMDFNQWQVKQQSIKEMLDERMRFKFGENKEVGIGDWGEKFDVNSSYVYVIVLAYNYDKLIAAEKEEEQRQEKIKEHMRLLEQERARQKNASAL